MEKIALFHGVIATISIGYFFKVKGLDSSFLTESFDNIVDIKNRITSEITEEIVRLATPIPDVYVTGGEVNEVSYYEGVSNPLKGDSFKNWLDDYLEKEISFIDYYAKFKKLFSKWKKYKNLLMNFSIFLTIIELINMATCFYLSQFCFKLNNGEVKLLAEPFLCSSNTKIIIFVSGAFTLVLIFIGLFLIMSLNRVESKVLDFKGTYNGL
ncbi:hypothetical protein M902_0727 [Bacteriovorax sp. BAL6_X]|uniref:hypothetical protein n=1 Tax=Bacteriovorax sp. BAL6_X TaxID=1201290 RepID=UPI0003861C30|nr:hypothetical protein [Bacteriovorax sp. BAL6_X]EPZ49868.1 hypothetical protein M902_0727 [Bacteriovorax sp. BAL6_X]